MQQVHPDPKPDKTKDPDPAAWYYDDIDATIAIYSHRVTSTSKSLDPDRDRCLYDPSQQPSRSVCDNGGNPAFHAHATRKLGTVSIYRHESTSTSPPAGRG